MPKLTEQQRLAIDHRDGPVVLSAGAGCGKTFVLTRRFLSHLDPQYPKNTRRIEWHQLVAITFTERAAREMRDRIRRECHERLVDAQGTEADIWWKLLRDIETARIATIHSFCGDLLRSHAVEARVDPNFQTLDAPAAETLLLETFDQCLRQRLQNNDHRVLELVAHFDVRGLRNRVLPLIESRGKQCFEQWNRRTPEEILASWRHYRDNVAVPRELEHLAMQPWLRHLLQLLEGNRDAGNETMQNRIATLCDLLPRLINDPTQFQELDLLRSNAEVRSGGGSTTWNSAEDYEKAKFLLGRLRKSVDSIKKLLQTAATATARDLAQLTYDAFQFALDVLKAYDQQKSRIPALDFDDLILRACDLLQNNDVLRKHIAQQIDLLLVDEFQDTDSVQLNLVSALCDNHLENGRLFVVGDLKQSIYRFRGAEPEVFTALRETIPANGRLSLTTNFRSQPSILHFVNALFCEALAHPQHPFEPLEAKRAEIHEQPKIEFLFALPDESPSPETPPPDTASAANASPDETTKKQEKQKDSTELQRRREADWIARRLKTMIENAEPIVGRGDPNNPAAARPVRPGDIVILFRAMSNVAVYEEALRRYDIGYYLVGGRAFFAQQEIYDLLNLLRAINSPADELSLLGALRSPIFSLDDETLFWLSQNPERSLSAGLFGRPLPQALNEATRQRVCFAADTIRKLRELKDYLPVAELIQRALDLTGYDAALLTDFLGARKLANLKKLIDSARRFEREGLFGLADFVTKLTHDVNREPHEELAALEAEGADVVRLMTVHQAKGLEFPVVVVADIDRKTQGREAEAAFDPHLGPVIQRPSKPWFDDNDCGGMKLWKAINKIDNEQELMRLFYVATTRAADYLILSAGITEFDQPKGPWLQLLTERFNPATGQLRAELPNGYTTPAIRVTKTAPSPGESGSNAPRRLSPSDIVQHMQQPHRRLPPPEDLAPLPPDATARRQFSVSSLTGQIEEVDAAPLPFRAPQPSSATPQAGSNNSNALLLGTLVHDLLADCTASNLDIDDTETLEKMALCRAADRGMLTPPIAEACQLVQRFLRCQRAEQIRRARQVHVEMEYLLAWPPDTQDANAPFLRGYIDCLYCDTQGAWHLLDYKTNQVDDPTLDEVAAHYELQMFIYALAAECCLNTSLNEIVLHFLRDNREYTFCFSNKDRSRLRNKVQQAIEKLTTAAPEAVNA